jgi:hypothetical protein
VVFKVSEPSISGFKLSLFYWKKGVPSPYFDPQIDLKSSPRPSVEEVFDNLSLDESSTDFFKKKVNGLSNLIVLENDEASLSGKLPVQQGGKVAANAANASVTLSSALATKNVGKEIIVLKSNKGQSRKILEINNTKVIVDKSWDDVDANKYILVDSVIQYGKVIATGNDPEDIMLSSDCLAKDADITAEKSYIEITSGESRGKIFRIKKIDPKNVNNKKLIDIIINNSDKVKLQNGDSYRIIKTLDKEQNINANKQVNASIKVDGNVPLKKNMFITVVSSDGKIIQTNTVIQYDNSTKTVTVQKSWNIDNPIDNTFTYNVCCGQLADGTEICPVAKKDYVGKETDNSRNGLKAFEKIDDISILYSPNAQNIPGLARELLDHCENMKDRFAIIDSIDTSYDIGTLDPRTNNNLVSKYAAYYYPWIKIIDPQNGMKKTIPPGGYMAGIYARSDVERGVHKAPANEVVRGVVDLEIPIGKGEQDLLNPRGVNCIRAFPGRGIRVWGARTLSSDPAWKYINVRRLFIYLEESIDEGTQCVVFEPNSEILWDRVKQTLSNFLTGVWKSGALMGRTPEEAFFVRCDKTTMTQDDIDNGRLIVMIGVAAVKPAEFVIFKIAQWTGSAEAEE